MVFQQKAGLARHRRRSTGPVPGREGAGPQDLPRRRGGAGGGQGREHVGVPLWAGPHPREHRPAHGQALHSAQSSDTDTGSTPCGCTPFCVLPTLQSSWAGAMHTNTGSVRSRHGTRDNSPPPQGCFPRAKGDKMEVFVSGQKLCTCK